MMSIKLIKDHPILDFAHEEKKMVTFTFDNKEMKGFEDDPIAAALHANGIQVYRITPKTERTRGFFCAIGKCSSCFMIVDGVPNVRTCVTPLKAGMKVETQKGRGFLKSEEGEEL